MLAMEGHMMLVVDRLRKYFPIRSGLLRRSTVDLKAVDDVSFSIEQGETFGLVGESGCGKTTIGKILLRLYEPTSGHILFNDNDVARATGSSLRKYRRNIQAVFQNPYASLNPRMRVWRLIGEPLIADGWSGKRVKERVSELLDLVGLPATCWARFPHEMSAGQRQQAAIARSLSISPKFIVLDEPTSLLDVSAQASILNLITKLQDKLGLTYLFISHNLAVVRFVSSRVGVMYCGKLVELAQAKTLYASPKHPYTKALLASVPKTGSHRREAEVILEGDVISPVNPPKGCRFHTRCQGRLPYCKDDEPPLVLVGDGRFVACHREGVGEHR